MYQHFLQTTDADVGNFLRLFTSMTLSDILELEIEHLRTPDLQQAQRTLAEHVTTLTHGPDGLQRAVDVSR